MLMAGLLAGGCSPICRQVINVTATDDICSKPVQVHLVGLNPYEKKRWDDVNMTDYWAPGNDLREGAKEYTYPIQFGTEPCSRTLGKKDPIRKKWAEKKATYLYILADLPDTDSIWRVGLPALGSKAWGPFQCKINIRIQRDAVVPLTIPKSKAD